MTLAPKLGLDIIKMYLHTETKFASFSSFSEKDKQTDTPTDAETQTLD